MRESKEWAWDLEGVESNFVGPLEADPIDFFWSSTRVLTWLMVYPWILTTRSGHMAIWRFDDEGVW